MIQVLTLGRWLQMGIDCTDGRPDDQMVLTLQVLLVGQHGLCI